ncbi:MAG: hypothetical protein ABI780_07460 [Ardenticatenales bacterium]
MTADTPRVLTVGDDASGAPALPSGPFDPTTDRTLEKSVRRWVAERTGLGLGYVEQLYTFGDRYRTPEELAGGPRALSIAYVALVREARPATGAAWRDLYAFCPWEDRRAGAPAVIDAAVAPALSAWTAAGADGRGTARQRRERADIAFGLGGAAWDADRALERCELLYEVGAIDEAVRDRALRAAETERGAAASVDAVGHAVGPGAADSGYAGPTSDEAAAAVLPGAMALDHRRILATALGRLRGKIKYRPVVFELLPPGFTLRQLQRVVEALTGMPVHTGNFRRLVAATGLVERTGDRDEVTGGRPAEMYRFRRDVLRERRAPGVGAGGGGRA